MLSKATGTIKTALVAVIVAAVVAPAGYSVGQRSTYDARQDAKIANLLRHDREQSDTIAALTARFVQADQRVDALEDEHVSVLLRHNQEISETQDRVRTTEQDIASLHHYVFECGCWPPQP